MPDDLRAQQLPSGMTLIHAAKPSSNNVCLTLVIRGGTRDERREEAGFTEWLTEMIGTATTRRPDTDALLVEMESLGATLDSKVEAEVTRISLVGPATAAAQLLDLLGDMVCHPRLQPVEVENFRSSLIDMLIAADSQPDKWLAGHLEPGAFTAGAAPGWDPLAERQALTRATRDRLLAFRRRFLDPQRMALVVSGPTALDPAAVAAAFGGLQAQAPRRRPVLRWRAGEPSLSEVRPTPDGDEPTAYIGVLIPAPAADDPFRDATSVLAQILTKRLFDAVRERRGLAYDIRAEYAPYEGAGLLAIPTWVDPKDAPLTIDLTAAQIRDLAGRGAPGTALTTAELEEALASFEFGFGYRTGTAKGQALYHAARWADGKPLVPPADRLAELRRVDAAAVIRAAQRLADALPRARMVTMAPQRLGPALIRRVRGAQPPAPEVAA